jgi:hypothetical protein
MARAPLGTRDSGKELLRMETAPNKKILTVENEATFSLFSIRTCAVDGRPYLQSIPQLKMKTTGKWE